jgi:hypothetical protein
MEIPTLKGADPWDTNNLMGEKMCHYVVVKIFSDK